MNDSSGSPFDKGRVLFGALFLSTGAALLVYVFAGVSLVVGVLGAIVVAGLIGRTLWRRASDAAKRNLLRAVRIGVVAGFFATLAYDLSRYLLIRTVDLTFWPFDIFEIFGQALLGPESTGVATTVLGVFYHAANGIGFAVAYTIWIGDRGVWAGIGFALGLEVLMVTVYPGWLDIRAYQEFLQVSVFGHVIYGAVLGIIASRMLKR